MTDDGEVLEDYGEGCRIVREDEHGVEKYHFEDPVTSSPP